MAVPEKFRTLALKVRSEIFGRDIRESMAQTVEYTGEAVDNVEKLEARVSDAEINSSTAKNNAQVARIEASEALNSSEQTEKQLGKVLGASTIDPDVEASHIDSEGVEHDSLSQRLNTNDQRVKETFVQAIDPYIYSDMGKAFDSTDPNQIVSNDHASWPHANTAYDSESDQAIVFYDLKPHHILTENRVIMRKKDIEGGFSDPVIVADRIADGVSCKTQASGICANGDYLSLVAEFSNSTGYLNAVYIYRSTDKGETWAREGLMQANGENIMAYNGDVTGFLVLKTGRILTLACTPEDRLVRIFYSDDNGSTWNQAELPDCYQHTEPAWCELSDGTIIAYLRETVGGGYASKVPARFTKSVDNGLTWSEPVVSKSVLNMTEANGHLIFHEESKTVEFIHHSRYTEADGYASLLVSVATEENAKKDKMGEQIRISKLAPQGKTVGTSTGDAGYIGACKSTNGVITVFYYNGTNESAEICYLIGRKSVNTSDRKYQINSLTGAEIKNAIEHKFLYNYGEGSNNIYAKYREGIQTFITNEKNLSVSVGSASNTTQSSRLILGVTDAVDISDYDYLHLVLNVVKQSGEADIGLALYNKKDISSATDGRVSFKAISEEGYQLVSLDVSEISGYFYPAIIVSRAKKVSDAYTGYLFADITALALRSTDDISIFSYLEMLKHPRESIELYDHGIERPFFYGYIQQSIVTAAASSTKESDHLSASITNSTGRRASFISTKNLNEFRRPLRVKAAVKVSGSSGNADVFLALYSKVDPSNGSDGRLHYVTVQGDGDHIIEILRNDENDDLFLGFGVSDPGTETVSIKADFYRVWIE